MIKIEGCELDIEKSSDGTNDNSWYLYFTGGVCEAPSVIKTKEPSILRLKKKDYQSIYPIARHLYFNPETDKYTLLDPSEVQECDDLGILLGGFIVIGCKLTFVYPKCTDDKTYIRPFEETFDEAFEKRQLSCDEQSELCGAFRDFQFDESFEIDCPIVEDNNAFDYGEFDRGEFETIPPDLNP